jgi:hypothetical protein
MSAGKRSPVPSDNRDTGASDAPEGQPKLNGSKPAPQPAPAAKPARKRRPPFVL